ncbi:MAG: 4-alpha-glucanotransferase [Candidatus Omnitrophica bacterium]|nr:4-alpha-glucanotransferase [Candidatus Omnitrophota bacterium]
MPKKDVLAEHLLTTPSKDKWERIGVRKRSGILAPLFSVYSEKSLGIGDLGDIKLLVDWCAKTGNSILQLLPMNEVGPTFCPYDAFSSFAIEPLYISLSDMKVSKKERLEKETDRIRRSLARRKGVYHVDYSVKKEKLKILRDIFEEDEYRGSEEFNRFSEENAYWLYNYALFKTLKEHHGGRPWYEWEEKFKARDRNEMASFRNSHEKEIQFQIWVQWQLYRQFKVAKDYAGSKNVLLKGDLPILISRDSADVWAHPEFFKLQFAAGAPPDMYCAKGQRWGMPTYDWNAISADGYNYLKEKLKFAENFYDMLRIDHVVGLFRIWSIPYNEPMENKGLNGFFDPGDESLWETHGANILSIILSGTEMLLCAEDLGVVPAACPKVLYDFGVPGNDVQRWVKDWNVKHDFLDPKDYRFLSVAVLSTHDTTNWAAWWEDEAGTIDEALFIRKCSERGIDHKKAKARLFDRALSKHGRLRWSRAVSSKEVLASILGKPQNDVMDFIDMYENSFGEKEKLWKILKLKGNFREKCDKDIMSSAMKMTLEARSIFCVNLIFDWLMFSDLIKGDPYDYRVNTPGTVSGNNWSLTVPLSLEKLLEDKICRRIKDMVASSGRI